MEGFIEIQWSAGSLDEARRVGRYLVQERLVASAQIVPWVESIYMWDNKLETTQECKVFMRTREALFDQVKEVVIKNSKYEVPEILKFKIDDGSKAFMEWIVESTPETTRRT